MPKLYSILTEPADVLVGRRRLTIFGSALVCRPGMRARSSPRRFGRLSNCIIHLPTVSVGPMTRRILSNRCHSLPLRDRGATHRVAPASLSILATASRPSLIAHAKGVSPSVPTAWRSAPRSIKSCATSTWPRRAASARSVWSSHHSSRWAAPRSSRRRTIATFPRPAASIARRTRPSESRSTSASRPDSLFRSSSRSAMSLEPRAH